MAHERKDVKHIIGKRIANIVRGTDPRYLDYLTFSDPSGKVLFTVDMNDLYDADGNRLYCESIEFADVIDKRRIKK